MTHRHPLSRFVAWTLIVCLANPAAMAPAFARDSDIFVASTSAVTTAEPNIMLVLDTSDSMNKPEPWREYPGDYDSHVEYLWNDINAISNSEVTAESASAISTADASTVANPTSVWGFWAGATLADRRALWNAAKAYANATHTPSGGTADPGARSTWRNYSDAGWLYWLPAGTSTSDPRLRSISFSAFRGGQQTLGGLRGGITFTNTSDYTSSNACSAARQALTPSTVFRPTSTLRNAGVYLNDQWFRWEPYTDLQAVNLSAYPGPQADVGTTAPAIYNRGYLDATVAPPASWTPPPPTTPARDNSNLTGSNFTTAQSRGQPIRIQQTGVSGAGWREVRADLGGFEYYYGVTNTTGAILQQLRTVYGYSLLGGLGGAGTDTAERFSAWLGNRDGTPDFGKQTGTPAYYDVTSASGACNPTTGPATATCINVPTGGVASITLTKTRTCTYVAGLTELDAGNVTRRWNGSCTGPAGNVCGTGITCAGDTNGAAYPNYSDVSDPAACSATTVKNNTFNNINYQGCAWASRSSVTVATCGWSAARTAEFVEGQGWFYYGGSCTENSSTASCSAGGSTLTINGVSRANVMGPYPVNNATNKAAGCTNSTAAGTWYYGGTCQGYQVDVTTTRRIPGTSLPAQTGPVTGNCTVSGVTASQSIRGTSYSNTVLNSSTAGCGNKTANNQTCSARGGIGVQCDELTTSGPPATTPCPNVVTSVTGGGTAATNRFYQVYNNTAQTNNLVHDCKADAPAANSSGYMVASNRTFGQAWNATVSSSGTTAAYTPTASAGVTYDSTKNIDVYSANYLNWKFGPKGPNNAPIGRKTRLQIAKDALTDLVQNTNGVRFGLMAFNRTAACSSTLGSMTVGSNQVTVGDASQFAVGDALTVAGATATTGNLAAVVGAISGNTYTLVPATSNPTTTGRATAASTSLTLVANTTGYAVGQSILIAGAGPSGADAVRNIVAISGSTFTLSAALNTSVLGATVSLAAGTAVNDAPVQKNPCSGAGTNDGAYVAAVAKRMGNSASDTPDYNNRSSLITTINGLTAAARTPLTESIYEAYRYFSGRTPVFGTSNIAAAAGGAVSNGRDTTAICSATGTGTGCTAIGAYRSPMLNNPNTSAPAGCQKNYIVLITDGGPEDDWGANTAVKSLEWAGPLGTVSPRTNRDSVKTDTTTTQLEASAGVPFGPKDLASTAFDGGYVWLDELVYFLANADVSPGARNLSGDAGSDLLAGRQSVYTYTIGFAGANAPILQNAATVGNGVYYTADNAAALSAALTAALAAITAWTPTGAAGTVPISVLNRSENATDVFLAFFQPDITSAWLGSVKKYKLSSYPENGDAAICGAGISLCLTGQTQLTKDAPNPSPSYNIETRTVDVASGTTSSAVDENTSSFWGPTSLKDGARPDKGGTGYQLITNTAAPTSLTPDTRKVYTFLTNAVALQDGNSGTTVDLTDTINRVHFGNATRISRCRLGDSAACGGTATMTTATQESLINWLRGGDVGGTAACNDGSASTACTTWRTWPHADVQHSRPALAVYNATAVLDPAVPSGYPTGDATALYTATSQRLYYLQNNGLLSSVDATTGIEKWAFMVEEALPTVQSQVTDANAAQIQVADGSPVLYVSDINGNGIIDGSDKVWLFFGLRRGGRVYYALDVTQPDSPRFGWKIDRSSSPAKLCVGNGACTDAPQFNELGQSWSTPVVGKVRANANPVLIFGGGYDPLQDAVPYVANSTTGGDTMGRAVFVIDAFDATVVQSWGAGQAGTWTGSGATAMNYSIPSDVAALNTDADAQGLIDRLYVGDTRGNLFRFDVDNASPSAWRAKLLATLSSDIASGERRKILFAPTAVKQAAPYRFDAVYVGTGDRENPLCLTANQTTPYALSNPCAAFAPANRMFMVVDRDYGLVAGSSAAVTVADLYERTVSDVTTGTSSNTLNTYKGWYRGLDNGEKVSGAPTVFANRLRFGTYAPLGQSNACVPPGEGRLNEIDAVTGDLLPINGTVAAASDRYYSSFVSRGYMSSGQLVVIGKTVSYVAFADNKPKAIPVGTIGSATKIYWYMEPEQ